MTTTCPLSELRAFPLTPLGRQNASPSSRPRTAAGAARNLTSPTALSRLWRGTLAEEARAVAPFERMGMLLLAFAGGVAILEAMAASSGFVEALPRFTAWAARLLGAG